MNFSDLLLDLLFPKRCVVCGRWGSFLCQSCQRKIDYFSPPASGQVCPYCERSSPFGLTHPRCAKKLGLDGMFILAHYRGPIRAAIKAIKYRGSFGITDTLADLITENYHHQYHFAYFVPVPLAPNREHQRGFNQAEKLANSLSKQSLSLSNRNKIPVLNILTRIRETKPQFDLKFDERKTNVRGAFALANTINYKLITNHSFCLIDDVATTGATIFECASVLKRSGALKVYAICVARGG